MTLLPSAAVATGSGSLRRSWRIARRIHPVGWSILVGLPTILLVLATIVVLGDVRKAVSAKPTTLYVTHCWTTNQGRLSTRYCGIVWTLPDGSRGSGKIKPNDVLADAGSTMHGWATPTAAWTGPKWEPVIGDWPIALVIVIAVVLVIGLARRMAERRPRSPAPAVA